MPVPTSGQMMNTALCESKIKQKAKRCRSLILQRFFLVFFDNNKIENPILIAGGAMMGKSIESDELIITKDLNSILSSGNLLLKIQHLPCIFLLPKKSHSFFK